ncbi:hypothetical protein FHS11_001289 [Mucilaginibacter gotjawali]|uniref:Uncharacterized protein n=1 Tax=Mucilaginibacter gotjawali TaxID=1550579 RepID=A0A839SC38_9SPHI|nr:hypothetical protein [Mucilaginibacter gotjawali]
MKKLHILTSLCLLSGVLHAQTFIANGQWRGVFYQPDGN